MKTDNQALKGTVEKLRLVFDFSGKKRLFAQLLFTVLAFLAMVSLSYIFVRNVISENLSKNAENVMFVVQNQVENDLNTPKQYLAGFSRTIRTAILLGDDKTRIKECIT
ncbi:MAG: hypothetical protein LBQ89_03990, partial [Treponema sp.]|nr:hypothetical protein [Treponema sp.]